jgi:hypothetical protein
MFRLVTGNTRKVRETIKCSLLTKSGCSIIPQGGYWKGQKEHSLAIEVTDDQESELRELAQNILETGQETVVLFHLENTVEFITTKGR